MNGAGSVVATLVQQLLMQTPSALDGTRSNPVVVLVALQIEGGKLRSLLHRDRANDVLIDKITTASFLLRSPTPVSAGFRKQIANSNIGIGDQHKPLVPIGIDDDNRGAVVLVDRLSLFWTKRRYHA